MNKLKSIVGGFLLLAATFASTHGSTLVLPKVDPDAGFLLPDPAGMSDVAPVYIESDLDGGWLSWDLGDVTIGYRHDCWFGDYDPRVGPVKRDKALALLSLHVLDYESTQVIPDIICGGEGFYFKENNINALKYSVFINGKESFRYSALSPGRFTADGFLSAVEAHKSGNLSLVRLVSKDFSSTERTSFYEIDLSKLEEAKGVYRQNMDSFVDEVGEKRFKMYALVISVWVVVLVVCLFLFIKLRDSVSRRFFVFLNYLASCRDKKKKTNIMNRESMSSYSVAEELLKWEELRKSGVVSQEEFDEAKRRIMKK